MAETKATGVASSGSSAERVITVRYWAAARSAAGTPSDSFPSDGPLSLDRVHAMVLAAHPGDEVARVLAVCSVLVGDQPVSTEDPAQVLVPVGSTVEFLPPFAGG